MKIGFVGLGEFGRAVQKIAHDRGHETAAEISRGQKISAENLKNCEIIFEATNPQNVISNVEKFCELKKNFVIATTGWYEKMDEIKKKVERAKVAAMWSGNFSVGVNLFFEIVKKAAQLFDAAPEFDIWAHEIHHKKKVDSPSGTAKILEKILLENLSRKKKIVEEKLDRKIADDEIHFSSTRGGFANFSHTICFDSAADFVKIEHAARNRDGYSLGAVRAMEWLNLQKPGFYKMEDFLKNIL